MGSAEGTASGDGLARLCRLAEDLGPALISTPTATALDGLVRAARLAFSAAAASVAFLDEDAGELVYVASSDRSGPGVAGMRIPAGTGIGSWVVATGQPVAVDQVVADPRFAGDVAERTGYVPDALLAAPIRGRDRVLGVLSVLDRDRRRPGSEQDLVLAGLFADQVASVAEADLHVGAVVRLVLAALADAGGDGEDLGARLRLQADELDGPDAAMGRLAAAFADLQGASPALADVAVEVLGVFSYHARRAGWEGG